MSVLDRMIATVAPGWALKRTVARRKLNILNSGYSHHGGNTTKKSMVGWNPFSSSADDDTLPTLDIIRQRSRDLYMGTPLATGALRTMRTNVVGTGLRLNPTIDIEFLGLSEEEGRVLKQTIEREFSLWADTLECDAQRMNNFYELQQLAFLSQLMSGDCFVLLPMTKRKSSVYDLRIRIIEADRCSNPPLAQIGDKDIRGGVELNKDGEVVAYWFSKYYPNSIYSTINHGKQEWQRVEVFGKETGRRNVLHLMESERPEQRRGVPILAPVIESLKQLGRYTEAELMAAVVSGMFTVFIKTEMPGEGPLGEGIPEDQLIDTEDPYSYELGHGSIVGLAPNESAEFANPSRPNTAFDGFVVAICRQIGAALELPYELLVKQFVASYSASRAALLEAWKMFRMRRTWLANDFCQPIYEEWFAESVAKGRIPAPGFFDDPLIRRAYTRASWHGPAQGQIDPLKEVKAAQLRIQEGLSTRESEAMELTGSDWEMNHRQRVREEQQRREGGLAGSEHETVTVALSDENEERPEE